MTFQAIISPKKNMNFKRFREGWRILSREALHKKNMDLKTRKKLL